MKSAPDAKARAAVRWLLLIHHIPPKPDYLRVKVGRRLQSVGAIAVKASVYALPDREELYEDFQWIRREIVDGGGEAAICRAEFVDAITSEQLQESFRAARNADYAAIADSARAVLKSLRGAANKQHESTPGVAVNELARLQKTLASVVAIDFFEAPQRKAAEQAVTSLTSMQTQTPVATSENVANRSTFRNRTWVTRRDVFVDRIASAWLIRRFIDGKARFKFVKADGYRPAKGEVRFDMFGGEFTHDGDRCTFETLVARFQLQDKALQELAEIVHDIDVKDGKFARGEVHGVEKLLSGIVATHPDDRTRLQRGGELFNSLYVAFSKPTARVRAKK